MVEVNKDIGDAITIDLTTGQHILFVKVDGKFNIRQDQNANKTFIYDNTQHIATINTSHLKEVHYI